MLFLISNFKEKKMFGEISLIFARTHLHAAIHVHTCNANIKSVWKLLVDCSHCTVCNSVQITLI